METIKKLKTEYKKLPSEHEKLIINTKIDLLQGVIDFIKKIQSRCTKKTCDICDILDYIIREIEG